MSDFLTVQVLSGSNYDGADFDVALSNPEHDGLEFDGPAFGMQGTFHSHSQLNGLVYTIVKFFSSLSICTASMHTHYFVLNRATLYSSVFNPAVCC